MHVPNVRAFVETMESALVDAIRAAGVPAGTRDGREYTGVWVGDRKIGSIGIHVSRRVSMHGFAVNVDNDLAPFGAVIACGLPDVRMTSLQAEGSPEGVECFRKRAALRVRAGLRPPPADRHTADGWSPSWSRHEFGLTIFPTDYCDRPGRARAGRPRTRASRRCSSPSTRTSRSAARRRTRAAASCRSSTGTRYDPFVALATVAQATERLRLGTGICLIVERDPIVTAKEVASLDQLSGGRFEFGVGAGWNREEMRNHGTDPRRRFSIMRERVLAMKAIWTQDEAEFHGEHVDFDPIWSWPKPVQKPHPPVILGGLGEKVLDRVLDYGDEWMPNRVEPAELKPRIAELRERAGRPRAGHLLRGARRGRVRRGAARRRRRPRPAPAAGGSGRRGAAAGGAVCRARRPPPLTQRLARPRASAGSRR